VGKLRKELENENTSLEETRQQLQTISMSDIERINTSTNTLHLEEALVQFQETTRVGFAKIGKGCDDKPLKL
jgi:hypothetical protein